MPYLRGLCRCQFRSWWLARRSAVEVVPAAHRNDLLAGRYQPRHKITADVPGSSDDNDAAHPTDPSGLLSRSEKATVDDQSLAAYVARCRRSEEADRRCNIGGSSLHSKRYPRFECCMAFVGVPYTRPVRLIERCVYPAGCHAVNAYPSTRKPEREGSGHRNQAALRCSVRRGARTTTERCGGRG